MRTDLPSGTVTFLFSDIEGSTRLLQRLDERYADVLAAQRKLLRDAFNQFHGHEVDTQGDSFFVAFARASDAIGASVMAQRALAEHDWHGGETVRVRMGLHTGAPQLTPAGYVGLDVHIAARLCAAAHGGQVLLSQQTHELAEQLRLDDVTMRELGEHRLKDLDQPHRIFQLVISNLPDEFPPLRTLDTHPHNLPIQLTSFVGREGEINELKEILTIGERQQTTDSNSLVRRPSSVIRLLTLTGAGGAGKTRLALQVAAEVMDSYENGVWFIELAPLADAALIPQAVAAALGVREQPGQPILDSLIDFLRAQEILLVLDNCEHLIEACARFADAILRTCPNLQILATSREALGIAGETTWIVPSLSLPDAQQPRPTFADLSQYEAVQLFVERAVAAQPSFKLTELNAAAVAHVCQRLDGIPLAIELAAARVRVLKTAEIAARLDDRFNLLTGGSRMALPRHQTLRGAIDWSYELLSEQERVLLRRMSVFAGGCTLEAAEEVASDGEMERMRDEEKMSLHPSITPSLILDLLSHLVDKSLIIVDKQGDETRYRMLETIREYARERLEESGEAEEIRQRHAEFFLNLAEAVEPKLYSGKRDAWLDQLEMEIDNLRGALQWSQSNEAAHVQGLCLASALMWFWDFRNHLGEGHTWLTATLRSNATLARTKARAKALYALGWLTRQQGDFAEARTLLEESVAIWREVKDPQGLAYALGWLGLATDNQGDWVGARMAIEEAIELWRALGDDWGLAWALGRQGFIAMGENDNTTALTHFEESERLWRKVGDDWGLALVLLEQGFIAMYRHDFVKAHVRLAEAHAIYLKSGHKKYIVVTLRALAELAMVEGSYARAKELLNQALETAAEFRFKWDVFKALNQLGEIGWLEDDSVQGTRYYEEAATILVPDHKVTKRLNLFNFGYIALHQGDYPRAAELFAESSKLAREYSYSVAGDLVALACTAVAMGRYVRGVQLLGAAVAQFEASDAGMYPLERKDYEHYIAIARVHLDEVTFEKAFAEGRGLTPEQAITYALETPEPHQDTTHLQQTRRAAKREFGGLTEREREVAARIAQGESNREIAEALVVSERTIETHVTNILNKLGFTSRAEIRKWAVQKHLVKRDE